MLTYSRKKKNLKVGDTVMKITDKDGRVKIYPGDQKMGSEEQCSVKSSIVECPIQKLILLLETV